MVNAEKLVRTFWRCEKCKEIYNSKDQADYCCSKEEIEKNVKSKKYLNSSNS